VSVTITTVPCCWGVDDLSSPNILPWERVLDEVQAVRHGGIELGPHGYIPPELDQVKAVLKKRGLFIAAGTIVDDLVSPSNRENLLRHTDEMCSNLRTKLNRLNQISRRHSLVSALTPDILSTPGWIRPISS
jgi:inosose dehydratase